jgi:hypothetical protein
MAVDVDVIVEPGAALLPLGVHVQRKPPPSTAAENDAKRTLNTTQAGQQYDEAGQLVMSAS